MKRLRRFSSVFANSTDRREMTNHTTTSRSVRFASLTATIMVAFGLAVASSANAAVGLYGFDGGAFNAAGGFFNDAGAHPYDAGTDFSLTTEVHARRDGGSGPGLTYPAESIRDVIVDIPAGFVGNPQAVPACTRTQFARHYIGNEIACPPESQVGVVTLQFEGANAGTDSLPVYRVEAPKGTAALFGFNTLGAEIFISGGLRTGGDYGIRTMSLNAPQPLNVSKVQFTLWGVPADPSHDASRGYGAAGLFQGNTACAERPEPACTNPSTAPPVPFLTLPTSCVGPVETTIDLTGWEGGTDSASFLTHDDALPFPNPIGNEDCDQVPFTPTTSVTPTSTVRDSASGVDASISVPADGLLDRDLVSQSHLKKAVVTLPEGVSVNPSAATGLAGCSDTQLGLDTPDESTCPDASKIGTVEIESPLLAPDEIVTGEVVLRTPTSTDPLSGGMLRMAIVARNEERGILVKIAGSATADPQTGRLVATFDNNPQLPFSDLNVSFKGGQRGVLAMPQDCGQITTNAVLSPWSGNAPAVSDTPLDVTGDCSLGFSPNLQAGMSSSKARDSGDFTFKFSRQDGQQWIDGLTATLPQGLLASVKDVTLCTSAQADTGDCPAGSRIGTVDATAGSGTPFVLERKGQAFLTEGYKGCAYGLAVKVPVVAGPFDASSPATDLGNVIVRQKICVDRTTAQVTAVSDPIPTIWHGIPLRVGSVTVNVDRPGFMLNPSDCSTNQVGASFDSNRNASSTTSNPFGITDCAALPFKPRLALSLTGRKQVTTGKHPGVKAVVTQAGASEAGIEKAVVRLPKSLALDPNNAQALCEFEDGTKSDLENHCPTGSIVGRARATTPLLKDDLAGNVYFVKNVRKDPQTGNLIRTLPMIIVALRGEIAVNLKGESDTTNSGKLVNTFNNVPDAPISQFNLNIQGGNTGILAVTRTRTAKINLCTGRHIAETDMDAQNGRRHDFDIRMKTPCTKKQTKAAKLRAKRAAAKARS